MDFEEFIRRLDEKGLSAGVFKHILDRLYSRKFSNLQSDFDMCMHMIQSSLFFCVIDSTEFCSLAEKMKSFYESLRDEVLCGSTIS